MTPERLAQLESQPQRTILERCVAAEMLPEAVQEIKRLQALLASLTEGK